MCMWGGGGAGGGGGGGGGGGSGGAWEDNRGAMGPTPTYVCQLSCILWWGSTLGNEAG